MKKKTGKPQILHTVRPRNFIMVHDGAIVPVAAPSIEEGDILFFDHLDGMYSYCKTIDKQVVHLSVFAEVIVIPEEEITDTRWGCDDCNHRHPHHRVGCPKRSG